MSPIVKWAVNAGLALLIVVALPFAVVAMKKSVRAKGPMAGVALSIGLAFSMLVAPPALPPQPPIECPAKREGEDDEDGSQTEV